MKRFVVVFGLLFSTSAFAGTISIAPFISGNDVTIPRLETQRSTLQTVINGSIEGGGQNIRQGSITSYDLATAINPVTFRNEAFNDWTYSGMLAPTSASLSSTTTAGISYVNGVRVETSATAHSYTASKDTYVYINAGGFFEYQEVANGASAPSTPANDLLLFKAVTSGTAVTSVTDLRTLSIAITANSSNFALDYRNQAFVSLDSTSAVHVEPGQIAIGEANYTNIADTSSRNVATAGNWIEGSAPNIKNLKFYVYAYNNSGSGYDFKYSSADPVYSDTDTNTAGTLRYYTSGGTTYRALAWISADTSSTLQGSAMGQIKDTSTSNSVTLTRQDTTTGAATIPWDNTPPLITEGNEYFAVPFRITNPNHKVRIDYSVNFANGGSSLFTVALFKDSGACFYAQPQQITNADRSNNYTRTLYTTLPNTNLVVFRLRAGTDTAGTTTLNGEGGAALDGGVMGSTFTVTEVEG